MMDIHKFKTLVASTMEKTQRLAEHNATLSKPAGNLINQYGPLTDKISKQRAVDAAITFWNDNKTNPQVTDAVNRIAAQVDGMGAQVVTGSVMAIGALGFLKDNFAATMVDVVGGVKPEQSKVAGILLAVMDSGITAGLAFVPVAGPFLVPLSQGLGSAITFGINYGIQAKVDNPLMLFNAGNASQSAIQKSAQNDSAGKPIASRVDQSTAATNAGKAVGTGVTGVLATADKEGVIGQLAAQKGIASLVYTAIALRVKKNEESVLKNCSAQTPFTKMMLGQLQSQNQQVATTINDIRGMDLVLPEQLRSTKKDYYLDEKKTLKSFIDRTNEMYKQYYLFIEKIINLGILESFSEPLARMGPLAQASGVLLDDSHKVALLILGYYRSKNWDQAPRVGPPTDRQKLKELKTQQTDLQQEMGAVSDQNNPMSDFARRLKTGIISRRLVQLPGEIQTLQQQNGMLRIEAFWSNAENRQNYNSAYTAYQQATKALHGKTFVRPGPGEPGLPAMEAQASNYFKGLKGALVADITSGMSNATTHLDKDEMVKMWKLYIGANLIVNEALRDAALKTESTLKKVTTFFKPKTAATLADPRYVQMIDDAGFIHRHDMNRISDSEKETMATYGKIRWRTNFTSSPSDAERAMLITFCIVVAFYLDVGKISLGFVSWKESKEALGKICTEISRTRFT